MICGKITRILHCKVAKFYRCLYGGGLDGGGRGGGYKLDPTIQPCIVDQLGQLSALHNKNYEAKHFEINAGITTITHIAI